MAILLVDGNGIQWRAYHSKGIEDDALRKGIFDYIFTLLWRFRPDDVILFWDVSKSRWRRNFFKSYKSDREERQSELPLEEIYRQVKEAKSYLSRVGFRSVSVQGIEADDLISWVSEYYSRFLNKEVVIVSGDKDLWQLINHNTQVYDYLKNDTISMRNVREKMGVDINDIASYKALVGDASDEIPGIKGIGHKTAIKLLEEYTSMDRVFQIANLETFGKKKALKRLMDDVESFKFCYRLVKSPPFYDARWYLNNEEITDLANQLYADLQFDSMALQIISSELEDSARKGMEYMPSRENYGEIQGILNYLGMMDLPEIHPDHIDDTIDNCANCSLSLTCSKRNYPNRGSNSKYMVVLDRDLYDNELVIFDKFLEDVGLEYSDIWITYSRKCDGFYPMEHGQANACSWFLRNELNICKPKAVFSFGSDSMYMLTDLSGKSVDNMGDCAPLKSEMSFGSPCEVYIMGDIHNISISSTERVSFDWAVDKVATKLRNGTPLTK